MQEQLITFETAKLAKEKGFNLKTHDYFSKDKYEKEFSEKIGFDDEYWGDNYLYDWNTNGEPFKPFNKECYSAPTQSLLQKWLREKHNLHIYIDTTSSFDGMKTHRSKYKSHVKVPFKPFKWTTGHYYLGDTYEEALEVGLQEALKLIK